MYALGILLYVIACGTVAWLLAKLLTRRAARPWARWAVTAALAPVVFLLPLADEIIGHFQFERLCESAKDVKIHGTIPVGEELYTPDGNWRMTSAGQDAFHLRKIIDGFLRRESLRLPDIHSPIDIWGSEKRIYSIRNGELLAEWRQYSTSGGWFGRNVLAGETPLIVRAQCLPGNYWKIEQSILRFESKREVTK